MCSTDFTYEPGFGHFDLFSPARASRGRVRAPRRCASCAVHHLPLGEPYYSPTDISLLHLHNAKQHLDFGILNSTPRSRYVIVLFSSNESTISFSTLSSKFYRDRTKNVCATLCPRLSAGQSSSHATQPHCLLSQIPSVSP